MISPDQTLLHLTSRGSRVRALMPGATGQWINASQQPMHNVNKFGLLHYSVPKTLDMVDEENRTFTLRFAYNDGYAQEIPVVLPMMDYYNITVDSPQHGDGLHTDQACFTEMLQTSINWAIQKHGYNSTAPLPPAIGPDKMNSKRKCPSRYRWKTLVRRYCTLEYELMELEDQTQILGWLSWKRILSQ